MRASDLIRVLKDIGLGDGMKVVDNGTDTNMMIRCPYHGEKNPSCGVSAAKEIGACFACHKSFTLVELVMYAKNWTYTKAFDYLEGISNVQKRELDKFHVMYMDSDDIVEKEVNVLPTYKLAPFRSGKITHEYLLNRGFTKEDCRKFKIGWDSEKQRVTIPIFNRDKELQGFIGRAVLEPKIRGVDNPEYLALYGNSAKYYIYPPLKKTKVLYPLDQFTAIEDTAILVEGQMDSLRMHQYGHINTLSTITASLSEYQVSLLYQLGVKKVILMYDNDHAGLEGMNKAIPLLRNDFVVYKVPMLDGYSDPCSSSKELIAELLQHKKIALALSCKKVI